MKWKKEDENKKGFWEKGAPGKNFSEKILWIENLSLCLQCSNGGSVLKRAGNRKRKGVIYRLRFYKHHF